MNIILRHRLTIRGAMLFNFALIPTLSWASQMPTRHFEPGTFSTSLAHNMEQPYYTAQSLLTEEFSSRQGAALVVEVQQALAEREYYYGDIDGIIGLETETALFLFQMDLDLNITGSINASTLQQLEINPPEWLNQ